MKETKQKSDKKEVTQAEFDETQNLDELNNPKDMKFREDKFVTQKQHEAELAEKELLINNLISDLEIQVNLKQGAEKELQAKDAEIEELKDRIDYLTSQRVEVNTLDAPSGSIGTALHDSVTGATFEYLVNKGRKEAEDKFKRELKEIEQELLKKLQFNCAWKYDDWKLAKSIIEEVFAKHRGNPFEKSVDGKTEVEE